MRISGIIHQQICQLKWHLLACIGLIMVLPIEEAMVSFRAGDGFYSEGMIYASLVFGPLLAGLIACANVQGDLNDKRYIFWRSKPANINLLITLKFFTGLAAFLFVITCPLVFHLVTSIISNKWDNDNKMFFKYYATTPILIAIMTYSLCFACNVVVRKTARAWLIGMLIGCFLLVLPFLLPLNLTDFLNDIMFLTFGLFFGLILVSSAAFVFALFAAKYDWHLKTNLKVLLWVVAGLAFALLLLFSSQVANIKVLDEKEVVSSPEFDFGRPSIDNAGEKLVFWGRSYIQADKSGISLSNISENPDYGIRTYTPRVEGYYLQSYPENGQLYENFGGNIYYIVIHAYYQKEGPHEYNRLYEKIYLRSYKYTDKFWRPVCELDISDCLSNNKKSGWVRMAMRFIDNKLIACVNNSYILLDATNPEELKVIDKKIDVLKRYLPFSYENREKEFSIPLVPIEEISIEERIKLSIDLSHSFYEHDNKIYESSIVDVHDDKFAFFFVDYEDVARFDVTGWDKEKIYCTFSGARPFTILEVFTASGHFIYDNIVKNGKLYSYDENTLMVFDVRSKSRIRKLGHFVRMDYRIEDIKILEDGNILACMQWRYDPDDFGLDRLNKGLNKEDRHYYLYLLKDPE
jgi:hypothetical protein